MNLTLFNDTEAPPQRFAIETERYIIYLLRLWWIIEVIIIPIVSLLGLTGNLISIILIARDGVRKSSNILLIGLALSDMAYLAGRLFISFQHEFLEQPNLLPFRKYANYIFFSMFLVCRIFFLNVGILCSYTFPMLITVERLCAVFFPLKFQLIVTPIRTLVVVLVILCLYSAIALFRCFFYKLSPWIEYHDKRFMTISLSSVLVRHQKEVNILGDIVNNLTGTVPITVLVLGSIAIGYKVKVASIRRARMMSQGLSEKENKVASQSRTTKTLLAVCVTFVVLATITFIHGLIVSRVWIQFYMRLVIASAKDIVLCINSSCNFFVYVFSNNKFRERLLALFTCRAPNPRVLRSDSSKM